MSYQMGTNVAAAGAPDISSYLEAGEQITWQGLPGRGGSAASQTRIAGLILLIVGAVLGIVFITLGLVLGNNGPGLDTVRGAGASTGLTIVGFVMLFSLGLTGLILLLVGGSFGRNNNYYLTNRRAIIITGPTYGNRYRTTFINLAALDTIRMIQNPDGSGTLVFGRSNSYYGSSSYNGYSNSYYDLDHSFVNIPNIAQVLQLVQNAQAGLLSKAQG